MGLFGSAIGAGLSAVGGIFGGISASKAMKRYRNSLNEQRERNRDWYNRRYNEDATQRAEAQRIITQTEDSIRNRNRQAAGTQAVMGTTEEGVAATKAAGNQALADAASQIAANADRRKDAIEAQYQAKDDALQQQLDDLEFKKAANISQAAQNVQQAGVNIAGIL